MMNRPFSNPRIQVACAAACLVGLGIWTFAHYYKDKTLKASQMLYKISNEINDTPTDRIIRKWIEAAKKNPKDDNILVNLGNILMQKARETANLHYYNYSEPFFRKALDFNPQNLSALIGIAWVHNSRHEFDQGIKWANKAIEIDPELQDAYALLGDAAVEIGDYDEAFEHYQKMLDIRPDLSSYSRASHLLFLTGDTSKAIWLMEKAISAGSPYKENIAWCRAELALMFFHSGALLSAERQAETALQEAPGNPHVLATMGRIKMAKKEYDKAIDFYHRAYDVAPNHDTLAALGDLLVLTGRPDEAEEYFRRVVALHNSGTSHSHGTDMHVHKHVHGNAQLARFYADHDQHLHQAMNEAEEAYRTYKNIFTMDTLAWSYYKNGRYEDARTIISKALKYGTSDAAIFFHAGMIYEKLGNRPAAQKYLYKALSLNPAFHPVYAEVAADMLKQLSAKR